MRDPGADPGHAGEIISRLAWERLGVPKEELVDVAGESDLVRVSGCPCLSCCPGDPDLDKRQKTNERINE